ncbi:MAG: F0F1 ATP synthase subunit alpha [Rickettsiales bacterium]|jgi:F-type H+-transporting ATPase subunit alpha|nr:F0F1 ATP synthase subunit alpha [Rickettsiales bacterium]
MLKATVEKALDGALRIARGAKAAPSARESGRVSEVMGGVVKCSGIARARLGELVDVDGVPGTVINLNEGWAGIAMLGFSESVRAGGRVARTGRIASVPVGPVLLGRVVDPLGRPLDGGRAPSSRLRFEIERPAHPIIERAPVGVPLQTGIKAVDSVIPIGRGQRELILGDRQTGKTAIALDAMLAQKGTGVICVYCAIGARADSVVRIVDALESAGCMKNCIVVSASGESPPGLLYVAPYAAASMAEYFMEREGRDVLVIYDSLSAHAHAYRQLSLFLRRPPGREAYPGDIFYVHSRLLERSTRLKEEFGGGSVTALPICETQAENISAYIPTNLISITDGQIFLSSSLFQKGVMPAVDIGVSVSRVGSNAQLPAYREVAGDMKISYSQFEELEAFSKFGAQLDDATKRILARGAMIREALKQPPLSPMRASAQVVEIFAVNSGALDGIPLSSLPKALSELGSESARSLKSQLAALDRGAKLDAKLKGEIRRIAAKVARKHTIR